MKEYAYVGPVELLQLLHRPSTRRQIQHEADILSWIAATNQKPDPEGAIIATFIIDKKGNLWIADRHSEHVVCASGGPVLSAGEITFHIENGKTQVDAITNQSTGFCPEPESWEAVTQALNKINLPHPQNFTTQFHFRLCTNCHSINIIKEDWFVCSICDADLNHSWSFSLNTGAK